MLVAVISEKNSHDVIQKIKDVSVSCDIVEVGFDKFLSIDAADVRVMRDKIKQPVIFTLRPKHQGGQFGEVEDKRLSVLMQLGLANPDYIDFEYTISEDFIEEFHSTYPAVKIIRSYHDFERTPQELTAILAQMIHRNCAVYKIVTMANSSVDVLRMMHFVKEATKSYIVVGHCMGEVGVPSRVIAPILGSYFQYVSLSEYDTPAPGILSQQTSVEIYRAKENNLNTKIYAVLGDPVSKSLGHIFHNDYFIKHGINAVYVKFKVSNNELDEFFGLLTGLPFQGFSVTMPLKKDIKRFVNYFDNGSEKIGAINTLRINLDNISALNTDGIGAISSVEKIKKVSGKKMLIIGAGGSARAIAFEAKKRGVASIVVINRTLAHCDDLVRELNCVCYDFDSIENASEEIFDFAFNTLPFTAELSETTLAKLKTFFSNQTVVMDINYQSSQSRFVSLANQCQSHVVAGYEMFVEQALMQQKYWL